ncbi:type-F conjugative transfer system protein TrbI [Enterobacter sp.]|uniref:type-F conjugative transfer system protein TrbI n=1 Tax=Enterobacter sp. TaxID=42895 RepID=UPI00296F8014|nr:type-F conjugative transfer system protein TrbI [Enterobacter sp.]
MGESSMTTPDETYNAGAVREGIVLKRRRQKWGMWALGITAALAATVAISLLTVRLATPVIVTFDMKGTVDMFMQQSAQQKLEEATAKMLTRRFNAALTQSLSDWQRDHNVVILVSPAVVSTQGDITPQIRSEIAQRMLEVQ